MGLKDKLFKGKKEPVEEEFPELEEEEDSVEKLVEEMKAKREKEKVNTALREEKAKTKEEVKEKDELAVEKEVAAEETEEKQVPKSFLASEMALYLNKDNAEKGLATIEESLDAGFSVGMQAGVMLNKENLGEQKTIVKYLIGRGYLVVVSCQKSEAVLDE